MSYVVLFDSAGIGRWTGAEIFSNVITIPEFLRAVGFAMYCFPKLKLIARKATKFYTLFAMFKSSASDD